MSSLVIDIIIWLLLFIGVGFGLIGLIGLLLFPETRSRMYTSVRATLIGICSVGLAVIIYGFYFLQTFGGDLYGTLILHTLLLLVVVIIGNYVISSTILKKTRPGVCAPEQKGNKRNTGDKK